MFRSLRVRNYRLYASGQVVSLTGTWMQRVAQDWLVLTLSNSGPAVAGVMINAVGTGWVFLVNAGSTLAVIGGLLLMQSSELHRSPPLARAKGQLREGLRYVRSRPDLLLTMLLVFVVGTFGLN